MYNLDTGKKVSLDNQDIIRKSRHETVSNAVYWCCQLSSGGEALEEKLNWSPWWLDLCL